MATKLLIIDIALLHVLLLADSMNFGRCMSAMQNKVIARRNADDVANSFCGRPSPDYETACIDFSKAMYPYCDSFPGKPQLIEMKWEIGNHTTPVIRITWRPPSTGYSSLWGFQVRTIEQSLFRPGYPNCKQINSKEKKTYTVEFRVDFKSKYQVWLYSMPPLFQKDNLVVKSIRIPGQCSIEEFKGLPKCCSFGNVTSHVKADRSQSNVVVNVTWDMTCDYITNFSLFWSGNDSNECANSVLVQNSTFYVILLSKECRCDNYTVQIHGILTKDVTTETKEIDFALPCLPAYVLPANDRSSISSLEISLIVTAIIGFLVGTIFAGFFIFKCHCKLRTTGNGPTYMPRSERSRLALLPGNNSPASDGDHYQVLLMHSACCQSCKNVVFYLYDYLNTAKELTVTLDMMCEQKIRENPLRWYEAEIAKADHVVVVTSHEMVARDDDFRSSCDIDSGCCGVSVRHQLNQMRSEISSNPDTSKYVPVFFDYNGSRRDVPSFLATYTVYRLPQQMDRVLRHLLNLNSLRSDVRNPVVELQTNTPLFVESMTTLKDAIAEAEECHGKRDGKRDHPRNTAVVTCDPLLGTSGARIV